MRVHITLNILYTSRFFGGFVRKQISEPHACGVGVPPLEGMSVGQRSVNNLE